MPGNLLSFRDEIANLLYAEEGNPLERCLQCGACSSTCPSVSFMTHTPRKLIELIRKGYKDAVLASNTYWLCSSCYSCTVKCPANIRITDLMYALKRYSIWKNRYPEGLIAPEFTKQFVKMILASGKAYEPGLAPIFVTKYGIAELINNSRMGLGLLMKGRLPLIPKKIRGITRFRRFITRIIPLEA